MDKKYLDLVKNILKKHLDSSANRAFIFGSLATGKASRTSDLDIGVEGKRISAATYFDILSDFEESDLPFTVDLVEFRNVSESFKKIAKKDVIKLFP